MYKLSASLLGHESDVKCVRFLDNTTIASVSRDATLRVWKFMDDKWNQLVAFQGSKYLNSVSRCGDNLVACGGQDATITICRETLGSSNETRFLKGHELNVCALDSDSSGSLLVSGSWDKTAKVWSVQEGTVKDTLKGHTQAVWSVLFLRDGRILTGSADQSIRLWELDLDSSASYKCIRMFSGHTDAVRGLCQLSEETFASCSNDMTIRVWSINDGKQVNLLKGHTSFIYAIDKLDTGEIVSSGEDRSVRIWKPTGELVQVITQPCISLWSVGSDNGTGDFVVGGSDYMIRIFSRDKSRWASESELKYFEQQVAQSGIGKDQVDTVKPEQLSPPDVLTHSGDHEGQVVMVKNEKSGSIEAHQWTSGLWVKIGEVVGSNTSAAGAKKVLYDGKEYDYVFDVDIQEGAPPLKLPYNVTENPYSVAQRFIDQNELPSSYLDQIAEFLIKNSEGVELASQPAKDPYGDRYIPGSSDSNGQSSSTSTSHTQQPHPPSSSSFSSATVSPQNLKVVPFKTYTKLISSNPSSIQKALRASNDKEPESKRLSAFDLESIEHYLSTPINSDSASSLFPLTLKIIQSWNSANILPALDLFRLVLPELKSFAVPAVIQTIFSCMDPDIPKYALLGTRAMVNLFSTQQGRKLLEGDQLREAAFDPIRLIVEKQSNSSAPQDLATSSLLLNYAVLTGSNADKSLELISQLAFFASKFDDAESCYRSLLCLGTIIALNNTEDVKGYIKTLELDSWVDSVATKYSEPRFNDLLHDLNILL